MSEYPSYLIHYGITGQKWGVRRFQNEDGTYTESGLLRRREQKYFVREQEKTNKKFDKITNKIQARQNSGKKVSDKQIEKAVRLGTKHRALDYISQNPKPYLKARGLNKASKARNIAAISTTSAIGTAGMGLTFSVGGGGFASSMVSGIVQSVAQRKLEKMFLNNWMERQYGSVITKSRNLTIADLESHGIKADKTKKDNEITRKKSRVF